MSLLFSTLSLPFPLLEIKLSHSSEPTRAIIEAVGGGKGGEMEHGRAPRRDSDGGQSGGTTATGQWGWVEGVWRWWLQIKRWELRMIMMNGWRGRKASETHSSPPFVMSLSKALNPSAAPVNQQQNKWLLLVSSLGEIVCVNMKQCPFSASQQILKRKEKREIMWGN